MILTIGEDNSVVVRATTSELQEFKGAIDDAMEMGSGNGSILTDTGVAPVVIINESHQDAS